MTDEPHYTAVEQNLSTIVGAAFLFGVADHANDRQNTGAQILIGRFEITRPRDQSEITDSYQRGYEFPITADT